MSDTLRVTHHLRGFGMVAPVLQWPQLICTWRARSRHKRSIQRAERRGSGSLIIHLFAKQIKTRAAQSNISQRSAPTQELIPEGKAAAGAGAGGGGDAGSLFIPSATAWNIHAAEIPQRECRLVQTHPSAGDAEPRGPGSRARYLEVQVFQYAAHSGARPRIQPGPCYNRPGQLRKHKVIILWIRNTERRANTPRAHADSGRLLLQTWMWNMGLLGES